MAITRVEAQQRASLINVDHYYVDLDLDRGDDFFESRCRIEFSATAGSKNFVDLAAVELHEATLNGIPLPPEAWDGTRLAITGLQQTNELVVSAGMRYSRDGQGLHRAVDPVDDKAYVYGHFFMDAAPRVYACFDQPDLKAPYDITVQAPTGWRVVANGAVREIQSGLFQAATTRPLATYFVTVCAGPYATITVEHDGITLGLHARASLADRLAEQAPEIFEITRASFDYYHELFQIRYPFGEYHQVFVPEFNAGAMENPGCVTFRDQLIFSGATSRTEYLNRANTISHEMAHMWFGDLVTMQWWDDLWLNESFAEYMANRTLEAATTYDDAWVAVAAGRKMWGYAADRSPSTHPIAGAPAPDTDTALQNFDGISYAKGSAALKQLISYIGDDAFIAGVRAYLKQHVYGNAALADFLAALTESSGRDLTAWSQAWLLRAGMDTLSVSRSVADGEARFELVITPPDGETPVRHHSVDVGVFGEGTAAERDASTHSASRSADGETGMVSETVTTPETATALGTLSATSGQAKTPGLLTQDSCSDAAGRVALSAVSAAAPFEDGVAIIANVGDKTWAAVDFDDQTLEVLPAVLAHVGDPTTRAMIWTALAGGVARTKVDPKYVLSLAHTTLVHETQMPILDAAVGLCLTTVVGRFLEWDEREPARAALANLGQRLIDAGRPAGLADARVLAGTRLVASSGDAETLADWFAGKHLPAGLEDDAPLRWRVALRMAELGALGVRELDEALQADSTMTGQLGYLTARAALPSPGNKEWAWLELTAPPTEKSPAHSNYEMNALAAGFWNAHDESTLEPFISRYVSDIPAMREWVGEDALARLASTAFPTALASEVLDVEARRMLENELPASVRRAVVDQHHLVSEVLASRSTFG